MWIIIQVGLNQDFTNSKIDLQNAVNNLVAMGGTNYNAGLLNPAAGGIPIAKQGKYKRVIVFLTDGEPNTTPDSLLIVQLANENNITIYCVTIDIQAPECLKYISEKTGGLCFENIKSKKEAKECYLNILKISQAGKPCQLEWESGLSCETGSICVCAKFIPDSLIAYSYYNYPLNIIANLEINPLYVKFNNIPPGIEEQAKITATARNARFIVTNVISSNPLFDIKPKSFILEKNHSKELTVSFTPSDSGYTYTKFTFENDNCPEYFYARGGFPGIRPTIKTINLVHPNGNEVFLVGSDTIITWEGIPPDDKTKIEYSTDNGQSWATISESSSNLCHNWKVPNTPSENCLARVTAKSDYVSNCVNADIVICNQIWMSCNLDVDYYRNGDLILEVSDSAEWANTTTGAWCHYENKTENGIIYGKLYNWYAVNDPRGLAPVGYHIPTSAEWDTLENCMGTYIYSGGKLKSTGTLEDGDGLWHYPNTDATDIVGFAGLPAGNRYQIGTFNFLGHYSYWWTASESRFDKNKASYRSFLYNSSNTFSSSIEKGCGFSVRCIKD